ncbi:hypothetical protein [Aeromicrobium erythreum]|uniref:Uncharacterized protein n=1 Tax=Aeromicrobium erythreum TaxID=2041 RepID=A0A0U4CLV0_9ACTN|nr:hypothetical protein [Aeromicrobium erythreum]ALX04134.1 hypothetical protein AERYTH_05170 [Aeromicrobium erythreum]
MASLTQKQMESAANKFVDDSQPARTVASSITSSDADRSEKCREAQNALRSAVQSADSALLTGAVINRLNKVSQGKRVTGVWATEAQDSLRASVLFGGAGLDRALKGLVEDTIPELMTFDPAVSKKLRDHSANSITVGQSVDPNQLIDLLLHEGTSPRDVLMKGWISSLTSSSAQSAERVEELASALGVTDATLRQRIAPAKKGGRKTPLQLAFAARNQIAHELDITQPEAEIRRPLEQIRRRRAGAEMTDHVIEMLDVAQLIINDVATRLSKHTGAVT